MPIIFVSPKKIKRELVVRTALAFGLVLLFAVLAFLFVVFASSPPVLSGAAGAVQNASVDLTVLDSAEIGNLEPFPKVKITFEYTATDEKNRSISGKILSYSKDEAQGLLEKDGFTVLSLEEATIGRDNPFDVYYPAK